MSFFEALQKPQYVLRPRWAARRLLIKYGLVKVSNTLRLPWGHNLQVDHSDTLGWALATQGVYDATTTEVLWRLTEQGSTALDVGANIGYFTSLLASRVGPTGTVVAFEPHPVTVRLLQKNVSGFNCANVRIEPVALSVVNGEGTLDNFSGQEKNTSHSFLTEKPSAQALTVKLERGEKYWTKDVSLIKIDAQWHEASVLNGFGNLLDSGVIRDIVFEEEAPYPAPSHKILLDAGYKILSFDQRLSGPLIISPHKHPKGIRPYEILPSYLATRDEPRARDLLSKRGWHSLRKQHV